ncbi:MAG: hypothetical protein RBT59_07380 [Arcobacteraceae bacterium]|jgi:hypothetical protein|nr:hypothetical protein [Arcobacteraceae bacterium]
MEEKKEIPQAVRDYMSMIGKRGGNKNKEKGSEYFSKLSKMRKSIKKTSDN